MNKVGVVTGTQVVEIPEVVQETITDGVPVVETITDGVPVVETITDGVPVVETLQVSLSGQNVFSHPVLKRKMIMLFL
jgi:hypothetical protein